MCIEAHRAIRLEAKGRREAGPSAGFLLADTNLSKHKSTKPPKPTKASCYTPGTSDSWIHKQHQVPVGPGQAAHMSSVTAANRELTEYSRLVFNLQNTADWY